MFFQFSPVAVVGSEKYSTNWRSSVSLSVFLYGESYCLEFVAAVTATFVVVRRRLDSVITWAICASPSLIDSSLASLCARARNSLYKAPSYLDSEKKKQTLSLHDI